jgi:hypothetical protein
VTLKLGNNFLPDPVAVTGSLGIYQLTLPVTETYTVVGTAKRFRFDTPEMNVTLNSDRADVDFTARTNN